LKTFPDFPVFVISSFISALSSRRTTNCIWELTYRCNARCDICPYWRNPSDAERELGLADLKIGLDRIYESGCRIINFSGGEPTLRDDLEEIISHASSRGFWTSLVTNGSLLNSGKTDRLKEAGLDNLFVSLDFTDGEKHDRLRGIDGLHDRVINALVYLSRKFITGHRTAGILCVISRLNSDTLKELVELAESLGVYITFQLYHDRKTEDGEFNVDEVSSIVSTLMNLKKSHRSLISSGQYLAGMLDYRESRLPVCQAGRKYFSIDPYGYLHTCVDLPPVGHILRDSISAVKTPQALELVKGCSGCWYCFRGEADVSLSISGCMNRIFQHGRIIYRNYRRRIER
jgi:MoaA/NifB/PqqE/SkfB family radical SAM enzyme